MHSAARAVKHVESTMTGEMAYFRYKVDGGEFVLEGERTWLIMFNGVRIGGMHPSPEAALEAIDRRRAKQVPGPNLAGVEDPPRDLSPATDAHLVEDRLQVVLHG